jgi:competence protein ComFC
VPIIAGNLVRGRSTKTQADLKDWPEREANMKNAFAALDPGAFKGKDILLVDDVTTSGATLTEAVRTLKSCGAKKIVAAVVARAR